MLGRWVKALAGSMINSTGVMLVIAIYWFIIGYHVLKSAWWSQAAQALSTPMRKIIQEPKITAKGFHFRPIANKKITIHPKEIRPNISLALSQSHP